MMRCLVRRTAIRRLMMRRCVRSIRRFVVGDGRHMVGRGIVVMTLMVIFRMRRNRVVMVIVGVTEK